MKDARRERGIARRLTGAVFFTIAAAVSFAVVAPDDGAADFSEAAVIPDDAEVSWLDGWEFTNGTVSLFLSPSFPSPRLLIGAEATEAPLAGALTADDSVIGLTALAEGADGWYTNVLDVSHPDLAQVVVALANDQATLSRVIAVPAGTAADETAAGSSAPSAGGTAAPPPLLAAPPASAPALVSGLVSEFYLASKNGGNYPGIPDFSLISPTFIKTDTTINFKSNGAWAGAPAAYKDYFATRHTGFIDIPADKTYTFYLQSDDGSMLYIDDQLVVDNGGLHGLREVSGAVYLAAGLHAIRVEYVEGSGTAQLVLRWSATGINKTVVPASVFYSYPYAGTIPPSVWLRSPAAGAIYKHLEPITLTAEALDLDGSVTSVSFYDGVELLVTLSSAPYEFVWTNQAPREVHALTALAVDADGNTRRTPPLEVTTVVRPAGLDFGADISFYSFSQNPTNLPDFSALTPFATGVVERLSNPWTQAPWTSSTYSSRLRDRFGVVVEGYLLFRENTRCAFSITSDDGARLSIGDAVLIDRDGLQTGGTTVSPYLDFKKGLHPFRVEYFQSTGGKSLVVNMIDRSGVAATISGVALLRVADYTDTDGDGMPDWWEREYGLEFDFDGDASLDFDGDGLNNLTEFINHSCPTNVDTDADGMPDFWEVEYGTHPNVADEMEDLDKDGLANGDEYACGTLPNVADTDGDGCSDYLEVRNVRSDPRRADIVWTPISASAGCEPADFVASTGSWRTEPNGAVFAMERAGSLTWSLEVPSDPVDALAVAVSQHESLSREFDFDLSLFVDGMFVARQVIRAPDGEWKEGYFFLPTLSPGNHEFRIVWHNWSVNTFLAINSIRFVRFDGPDADENGISDWKDSRTSAMSGFDILPYESWVSPVCVEGYDAWREVLEVAVEYPMTDGVFTVCKTIGDGFYVDIPLVEDGITGISMVDRAVTNVIPVVWREFDITAGLYVTNAFCVRTGDALKIAAIPQIASEVSIYRAGASQDWALVTNWVQSVASPYRFDEDGHYLIASISPVGLFDYTNAYALVDVVSSRFPKRNPAIMLDLENTLECPDLSPRNVIEHDVELSVSAASMSAGGVTLELSTTADRTMGMVSRLCEGGAICDAIQVTPLWADNGEYYHIAKTYPDGSQLVEISLLLGAVVPDMTVYLEIFVAGVMFEDGTRTMTLTADDFDENGHCMVSFIRARGVSTSVCHRTYIRQNGELLYAN